MPVKEIIEPGYLYHLYNHANGNLQLFRSDENYHYFLAKYKQYVHPFVDTLAYCLMPNHFHFAVRIKDECQNLEQSRTSEQLRKCVTNSIKNWLISYTQFYNFVYSNRGNLYHQKIRRKKISDQKYLLNLIGYIHLNPVKHGFVLNPYDWIFSSYATILSKNNTFLQSEEVLSYFDDEDNFRYYHDKKVVERFAYENNLTF